jgi:hypothetical protein
MSSSADSSLSARCLEAEEWLRQVYHGGCPCASSLYARAVCMCVRACVRVYLCACACVCVHQDMIDATGASQRRHLLDCESGCVATAGIGGEGMLLRVRVRVAVRAPASNGLRLWCFRLCFRLCFAHATIAPCASRCSKVVKVPATTLLLLAPQASPHGAAGEPRKNPCYYALKSLRAPSSWARFSVVFSQAGDLGFPIFTKPVFGAIRSCTYTAARPAGRTCRLSPR